MPSHGCKSSPKRGPGEEVSRRPFSANCYVVQNPCAAVDTEQWVLTATSNGYYTISNKSTGLLIDLSQGSVSAGTSLDQTELSGTATQSQQWLLRPAFFRGVDNALLEKQEAARAAIGLSWWKDAGQQQDVLQIFKNHGVNMVRLRPSSVPPYANVSQAQCSGNACYAETDAQDLDLAKRAKNLGMSVELTLLFDGGSSSSVPPAWANDTLAHLQSDLYAYVKAEILSYRQAGTMPDLVSIGNEVDTGFLGSLGSPTGADFGGFAALQIEAMQAVKDAAADTSIGPAIPAPLTCIHITPAWDLTQFFTLASDSAKIRCEYVGIVPRSTWCTSSDGFSTSTAPMQMISTCVARSSTARIRLRFADSPIPRMFSQASSAITIRPPITSPGRVRQRRPERAQVVGHEERRDRDREDVVEAQRPPGDERHELVERVPREARGAAGLGEHRRALGVRLGGQREQAAGEHEHDRREPERVRRDQAERVVDRRAHVAVGGREQTAHPDAAAQSVGLDARHVLPSRR